MGLVHDAVFAWAIDLAGVPSSRPSGRWSELVHDAVIRMGVDLAGVPSGGGSGGLELRASPSPRGDRKAQFGQVCAVELRAPEQARVEDGSKTQARDRGQTTKIESVDPAAFFRAGGLSPGRAMGFWLYRFGDGQFAQAHSSVYTWVELHSSLSIR